MAPNVLLVVADDLNAWIGGLGRNPDVRTPHIDALARRGTLFTHAYCAAPYCHSSRISFLTGCQPATTGIYHHEPYRWDDADRPLTLVELLHDAGYRTFGAGKVFHGSFHYREAHRLGRSAAAWHNDRGNDAAVWDGFAANRDDPLPDDRPRNGLFDYDATRRSWPFLFDWAPVGPELERRLPDRAVTDAVCGFLGGRPPEPFFCAAGLYKPHLPWFVPARYYQQYQRGLLSLPLVDQDDLDDVPPQGRLTATAHGEHALVTRGRQWRDAVHAYLAAISYCDDLVGEMTAALDASGLAERTTVVLLGDNGFHLGEKLHWRKMTLWEEATRVPLVIVPPGGAAGQRVHDPVSLVDVFPTVLEACGVAAPTHHDGQSLTGLLAHGDPALTGAEAGPPRRPALSTWQPGNHSVRSADWRYIRYLDHTEELYDHRTDPYEWENLAGQAAYRPVIERLARFLPDDAGAVAAWRARHQGGPADEE